MIEVEIQGLEEIKKKISKFELFTELLGHDLGNIGTEKASIRIESSKISPTGQKWANSKRSLVDRSRLLKDTGALHKSIGYSLAKIRQGKIILNANIEYSGFLQDGTKNMPARPFLGLSKEDIGQVKRTVLTYIKKQL